MNKPWVCMYLTFKYPLEETHMTEDELTANWQEWAHQTIQDVHTTDVLKVTVDILPEEEVVR